MDAGQLIASVHRVEVAGEKTTRLQDETSSAAYAYRAIAVQVRRILLSGPDSAPAHVLEARSGGAKSRCHWVNKADKYRLRNTFVNRLVVFADPGRLKV